MMIGEDLLVDESLIQPARSLTEMRTIVVRLLQDLRAGATPSWLRTEHLKLTRAARKTWNAIEMGTLRVGSKAVMREIWKVTCPDIGRSLHSQTINHERIARDVSLLLETIDHVLVP
ncbi:MAG: hypothetical protein JSW61_03825 [Candidatus Thorarchaeota archaeon]|nr:MAG: hypothetical protein JSW61_03825 [Candidatus Thorarchaeota archaeon]